MRLHIFLWLFLILSMVTSTVHGQLSLREQAWAAMSKKEFGRARSLLERWIEADPADWAAWYNLASAHAMTGNKERALYALVRAVVNGFMDPELVHRDPNLESLRSEERYKAAVDRIVKNHKESIPDGFLARMAPMRTLGTYVVMLPPNYETTNERYPLVVILHGSGSNEIEHGRVVDSFGREGVIYAAVRAPFPALNVVLGTKKPAYTAWPAEAGRNFEPAQAAYIDWIFDVAEHVRNEFRVREGKIFLWGHSQGGQFAKLSALLHPNRVASFFSQAGSSVSADMVTAERLAALKREGVDVWLAHGVNDPSVPARISSDFAEKLKGAGITAKLYLEEGDHSINDAMKGIARRWISEVVKKPR